MVNLRIAKDIGPDKEYHLGRIYIILYDKLPFEKGALNLSEGDFIWLIGKYVKFRNAPKQVIDYFDKLEETKDFKGSE